MRDLRDGVTFALELSRRGRGYILQPVARVGQSSKPIGSPIRCDSMTEALIAIETWAQDQLARHGLEETT